MKEAQARTAGAHLDHGKCWACNYIVTTRQPAAINTGVGGRCFLAYLRCGQKIPPRGVLYAVWTID
jgi:hypothetical protein